MHGKNTNAASMNSVLPKHYDVLDIYVTHRFDSDVGVSVGIEQSNNRSRSHVFTAGEKFLAHNQTAGDSTQINNKLRAGFINLVGYMPFIGATEAIGELGFSLMQSRMTGTLVASGVTHNLLPDRKYNFIPRASIGLQYFGKFNVGVRFLANWEGTSNFMLKLTDEDGVRRKIKPFKSTLGLSIGVVAKFGD